MKTEKLCTHCGLVKSAEEFYYQKATRGLASSCKMCWSQYMKDYNKAHPRVRTARIYYREIKFKVIAGYGGRCACCSEDNPNFLTLDHVNGGGKAHREKVGNNGHYMDAFRRNFPVDYQVLCFNCNCSWSRRGSDGVCAHHLPKPSVEEFYLPDSRQLFFEWQNWDCERFA